MPRYVMSSVGPGLNTTAATTQNIHVYNPAATTTVASEIYEFSVGPHANSADNTYTIRALRTTTTGTFTNAITPSPLDTLTSACNTITKNTSSVAATGGAELGRWGFHMRGGYRWVAIPGGELVLDRVFSHGITWDTVFAQGSDACDWAVWFLE